MEPVSKSGTPAVDKPAQPNIEKQTLKTRVFKASHPNHGELQITRQQKSGAELNFDLELTTNEGETLTCSHTMFVSKSARNYKGESAVGCNYIDLDELQGRGIGTVYFAAAAQSAAELGASLLVVDDVVEPAMHKLCQGVNMKCRWGESYSIKPEVAADSFRYKAQDKGWNLSA